MFRSILSCQRRKSLAVLFEMEILRNIFHVNLQINQTMIACAIAIKQHLGITRTIKSIGLT